MEEETTLAFKSKSSRFSRTIHRVINLRSKDKNGGGNKIGICILPSSHDNKSLKEETYRDKAEDDLKAKHRAVLEAVVARLFAGASTIKAAYAELQLAQYPYDGETIQASDQAVVDELRAISELKRKFLRRELDISPQVTLMLAEIQEQQSLLRTYEITIKKLEAESDAKDLEISALRDQLGAVVSGNKAIEKRLNASGCLSLFDNFRFGSLGPAHFVQVLHFALRSARSFVKVMVKEMESAKWDLDEALKFIEPEASFAKPSHRIYGFESFVCKSIFEGFNFPNFMLPTTEYSAKKQGQAQQHFFDQFKKLKSVNPKHSIAQNPNSSFAKFTRAKYLTLVHAKMECSFFGNLGLRKLITSGGCPADSSFFTAFAEMCKRVWVLHCLAFSFDEEVSIFQAKRNSRFSEVFMESVTEDVLCSDSSGDSEISGTDGDEDIQVEFTVVPGFKIGRNVVQCQVYLSPVAAPVSS
ncbi:protein GRAVITROPIC IN THE LIGHT 1 [Punica granatum]|uniref:Uncharacterized protein n=2 Tax=Punica granatum TaxID=22663 RepID=A0A218WJH7_PUNGR|nr:protein GRAVITROPIC IN THE LIGHT 1 [Punica granatum]OWM72987.1 hypothetical protein CDL15_Pgr001101 [Punica granatum]PKI69036.1 hypothetical protein CRG98_010505 [Punica granatum]